MAVFDTGVGPIEQQNAGPSYTVVTSATGKPLTSVPLDAIQNS